MGKFILLLKMRIYYTLTFSMCVCAQLLQPCPTLCDPVGCSLRGSSVHRILQARTLEWVAMPSSSGSSRPRGRTGKSLAYPSSKADSLPLSHPGGPNISFVKNYFPKQGEGWLRGEVFAEETGGVGSDSQPHCLNSWGYSWAWSPAA